MAVLDAANRAALLGHICRVLALPTSTKPDIDAAIAATDDWIEANQTSFNNALPLPFRTNATLVQKTVLFAYVAFRRAGLLKVQGE